MSTKTPNHHFAQARRILTAQHSNLALLFGNGINLASAHTPGLSWKQLMIQLVKDAAKLAENPKKAEKRLLRLLQENEFKRTPASYPEVFDIIDATCNLEPGATSGRTNKIDLPKKIAALFATMEPGKAHRTVVRWAAAHKVPVMTTNYDHCLQDAVSSGQCKRRILTGTKKTSDYYPWNRYYAPDSIQTPDDKFAVWHIHGDYSLRRSIRIGLDQYMGMVQRLRKLKRHVAKEILSGPSEGQERDPAYLAAPWLRIFMGRKLWIQGLGLHSDEVSLRWLLIQRFRYWKRYKPTHRFASGWYVHGPTDRQGSLDDDRRAFLESVGIEILEIGNAQDCYQNLFSMND